MSVSTTILQGDRRGRFSLSNRTFGLIGMILSPMLWFASFFFSPQYDQPNSNPLLAGLGGVLYILGAAASAAGMRKSRVTGNGAGAKILYVVQMSGLFLAMCFDILDNAAPHLKNTTIHFITDMAYPFSHFLMIVVGIAVVRAGVWRGWKKIPAFLVGSALLTFLGLSLLAGAENVMFVFPLMVTSGFFLLGLAVFTTDEKINAGKTL